MDKSTDAPANAGSKHGVSSSGETTAPPQTQNISLGCGSTTSSPAAAPTAISSGSTTNSAAASACATTSNSRSHTLCGAARKHAAGMARVPLPLGTSLPVTLHSATSLRASHLPLINLNITTTTGGNFGVTVDPTISVENLKKIISKKLKVSKDRICLLHREKELQDGNLQDNNLMDGSKIILIPNVETGLMTQRPENTVMQALESLNDSQVNDFLSGKTPLNLSMRLGDHMMLIQLQLSTVNPANAAGSSSCNTGCTRSRTFSQRTGRTSGAATVAAPHHNHHHNFHHHHHSQSHTAANSLSSASGPMSAARKLISDAATITCHQNGGRATSGQATITANAATKLPTTAAIRSSDLSSFLSKRDYASLQNIVKSIAMAQPARTSATNNNNNNNANSSTPGLQKSVNITAFQPASATVPASTAPATEMTSILEQSPIKSLSNLVSSPIKTAAIKNIPIAQSGNCAAANNATDFISATAAASTTSASLVIPFAASSAVCQDPIAAKLTSCLCTRLNAGNSAEGATSKRCIDASCTHATPEDVTDNNTATQRIPMHTNSAPIAHVSSIIAAPAASNSMSLLHKTSNNPIVRAKHRHHHHHHHHHHHYHHYNNSNGATSNNNGRNIVAATIKSKLPHSLANSAACDDSPVASEESSNVAKARFTANSRANLLSTNTPVTLLSPTTPIDADDSSLGGSDTRTLAEASRNLTQTLRKLSKEVFTNKIDLASSDDTTARKAGSGAVIESMKNHGKGIYSGTFSGTLNPALQDRYGRPKRDISTVIHILNDLLSATPQYSRGARISFEAPSTSAAAAAATVTSGIRDISSVAQQNRCKQLSSKHQHATQQAQHQHHACTKCIKVQPLLGKLPTSKSNYVCYQELADSNAKTRNTCSCRYRNVGETGEREREHICHKCLVEMENFKTKSKLDQLRLVMQQRKQKREARKLKGAPYGGRVVSTTTPCLSNIATASVDNAATAAAAATTAAALSAPMTTTTAAAAAATTTPTAAPSEVSTNHIVEEVDTAA